MQTKYIVAHSQLVIVWFQGQQQYVTCKEAKTNGGAEAGSRSMTLTASYTQGEENNEVEDVSKVETQTVVL